ncbi:MAG: Tad domain-containing protein [Clostridia bacterium]|nr:Tad domain-containing protein [Clostridia bacterium]
MKRFNQKENRNKEKHTRGSITVFVALLLVPMIVVNGFLVDLSRMKLYGNQAAMTADNYGDAVLSVYSNLLKDLYGLFAVSESSEGEAALAELEKYITSSFNPQENWLKSGQHFTSVKEAGRDKSGFMPYQDAEVKVSYVGVEDYTLYNDMILANQIGDFMKYRIVQSVMNSGDTLLETVKEIKKSQDNGKVVSAKHEFDEAAKKVMEDMEEFYKLLKKLDTYPEYVGGYNT